MDRSPPHTAREDFEHFLAYSSLAAEDEDTRDKLWQAWQHARSPKVVEELVVQVQGGPNDGPPPVDFSDPEGARVDLGEWVPLEFHRWELRVPLRPLVRTYVPRPPALPG